MKNNRHSTKVRVWIGHITWVHIQAKLKEDFINTLAVISKTGFEQRGMLHQDYQLFVQNNDQDTYTIAYPILKDAKVLLVTSKDMAHFQFLLM